MEKQIEVFIFASQDVQNVLADNGVDIADLLDEAGVKVRRGLAKNPATSEDSGYKEPTSVILASAALILALTPVIKKVIDALSHKSVIVQEMVCVPVEDSNGDVIRDKAGAPVLQWVERSRIIEPSNTSRDRSEMTLKGPFGFELRFSDLPQEQNK